MHALDIIRMVGEPFIGSDAADMRQHASETRWS
jgi:hypothetical protein